MSHKLIQSFAVITLVSLASQSYTFAAVPSTPIENTITVGVSQVPDEQQARVANDAPAGYGTDSWQGPATGKTNVYITPSQLFGTQDANITLADIASVTYYTKRAVGSDNTKNWFFQVYTANGSYNDNSPDHASWFHDHFSDGGDQSTPTGDWQQATVTSVFQQYGANQFDNRSLTGTGSIADVYGDQVISSFSMQTSSNFDGFDGLMDGLTVTLQNGDIGHVNFSAVPEPASIAVLGLGAIALLRRRRKAVI